MWIVLLAHLLVLALSIRLAIGMVGWSREEKP